MSVTAFLVIHVETESFAIVGAGVYSEKYPTLYRGRAPVVIAEQTSETFDLASTTLLAWLRTSSVISPEIRAFVRREQGHRV